METMFEIKSSDVHFTQKFWVFAICDNRLRELIKNSSTNICAASGLVCVMCDKRLGGAERLLEHFSLEHGLTLWRQAAAGEGEVAGSEAEEEASVGAEEVEDAMEAEDTEEEVRKTRMLPLEFSVRLLQLKWMMNNHPRLSSHNSVCRWAETD